MLAKGRINSSFKILQTGTPLSLKEENILDVLEK